MGQSLTIEYFRRSPLPRRRFSWVEVGRILISLLMCAVAPAILLIELWPLAFPPQFTSTARVYLAATGSGSPNITQIVYQQQIAAVAVEMNTSQRFHSAFVAAKQRFPGLDWARCKSIQASTNQSGDLIELSVTSDQESCATGVLGEMLTQACDDPPDAAAGMTVSVFGPEWTRVSRVQLPRYLPISVALAGALLVIFWKRRLFSLSR